MRAPFQFSWPRAIAILGLMIAALAMAGCDRDDDSASPRAVQSSTATRPAGMGTIIGRVVFIGPPPPTKVIPGSPNARDESLVVGTGGGIQNVIVYLTNPPGVFASVALENPAPVVLDQVGAVYVPHVIALQAGQALRLKSSDAMMHNVHLQCVVNPEQNYGFSGPGQHDIILSKAEAPFRVKCDVHPWMTAWVGVFSHPYFAVTDDQGRFSISDVPAGDYTIAAWQESLPPQQAEVTIIPEKQTNVTIPFPAP